MRQALCRVEWRENFLATPAAERFPQTAFNTTRSAFLCGHLKLLMAIRIPEREAYPRNEDFGYSAWSYGMKELEAAKARFELIQPPGRLWATRLT
jgi:hypothetical protein